MALRTYSKWKKNIYLWKSTTWLKTNSESLWCLNQHSLLPSRSPHLPSPSPQWDWDSDCRQVQPRHRASPLHRYQSERCLPRKVILSPVLKLHSRWVQPRNGSPSFYPDPIHERGSTLVATSLRIFLALITLALAHHVVVLHWKKQI